jgi:hypothetical protein
LINQRLIAHYCQPRSGSTYVEVALREYFAQHGGHRPLSEYFNTALPVSFAEGEPVVDIKNWTQASFTKDEMLAIKDQRIEWLQQSRGRYYFKTLGHQLTHEGFYRVFKDCEVILSYRQNEWAQLLSFILSYQTGQYYENDGIDWQGKCIEAEKKSFVRFITERRMYQRIKTLFSPEIEICFERFLNEGGRYMAQLGLDLPFEWDKVIPPPKQSRTNNEELITNVEEVRQWFVEAGLEIKRG